MHGALALGNGSVHCPVRGRISGKNTIKAPRFQIHGKGGVRHQRGSIKIAATGDGEN